MQTDIVERPVQMILVARVVGLVMDARCLWHPAMKIKSQHPSYRAATRPVIRSGNIPRDKH
jgi:hypothetical protein